MFDHFVRDHGYSRESANQILENVRAGLDRGQAKRKGRGSRAKSKASNFRGKGKSNHQSNSN